MKLKLQRSQTTTKIMQTAIFRLHAIVDVTPEERSLIHKYGLAGHMVYTSEKWKSNLATVQAAGTGSVGIFKGFRALAANALSLTITISDLINGKQVECKSIDEMLGTEEAIINGCQILKGYLETAATFDGREVLIEI